jgi:hypothetical protein
LLDLLLYMISVSGSEKNNPTPVQGHSTQYWLSLAQVTRGWEWLNTISNHHCRHFQARKPIILPLASPQLYSNSWNLLVLFWEWINKLLVKERKKHWLQAAAALGNAGPHKRGQGFLNCQPAWKSLKVVPWKGFWARLSDHHRTVELTDRKGQAHYRTMKFMTGWCQQEILFFWNYPTLLFHAFHYSTTLGGCFSNRCDSLLDAFVIPEYVALSCP